MNKLLFLQTFLKAPAQVGSVIPSSRFMIQKVISCAKQADPDNIVELGAGTGVITRQLQKLNKKLLVFEKEAKMREHLVKEFSTDDNVHVYTDAYNLVKAMQEQQLDQLDCVICGLPLTLFPQEKKNEILHLIHEQLKDNGDFIIYQYSLHLKKPLQELYSQVKISFTPLNVPPCFVFHCKK